MPQPPSAKEPDAGRTERPATASDPSHVRLLSILSILLAQVRTEELPDWTFARWHRALQYPETHPRAQASTRELGRLRDEFLALQGARALAEWAGGRRRSDPVVGAAAALTMVSEQLRGDEKQLDLEELAIQVTAVVDTARTTPRSSVRRIPLLHDPDLLAEPEPEARFEDDPRLPIVVRELLRLAGAVPTASLLFRVETAVLQAGEWWARHATPPPAGLDGPSLPGVVPAQRLRHTERLGSHISDAVLLELVAGPQPGRKRPCQVAWRRGLTFWSAANLALGPELRPSPEAIRWWRTRIPWLLAAYKVDDPIASPRVA